MPEIIIENLSSKTIHCGPKSERLLDILVNETECMHACGGNGRCTTCAVVVLEGIENLSSHSEEEARFINLGKISADERLACQCFVKDKLRLRIPDRNKLPHIEYSE
ncbi:MAG: (2Fe-2S)-binding protein [Cyclobacteriaceae bacterium]